MKYAIACNFICACTFLDRQYGTERYWPYCVDRKQHVHLMSVPYLMRRWTARALYWYGCVNMLRYAKAWSITW